MKSVWLFRALTGLMLSLGWGPAEVAADPEAPAGSSPSKSSVTHVDPATAEKRIAESRVVVLDIRTPQEYAAGHLAGARNLDFNGADFAQKLAQLDRNQTYLVHCASGRRSTQSLETFQKLGFTSVLHLDGGIKAWTKAGKPIQK